MEFARTVLKGCMEQTCAAVRIPFGRFGAEIGLNDFLLDAFDVPRSPKEIAVLALDHLCQGDMNQSDQVVCLAVISFLDETLRRPSGNLDRGRQLKDLAELVTSSGTCAQFERWIETWYE